MKKNDTGVYEYIDTVPFPFNAPFKNNTIFLIDTKCGKCIGIKTDDGNINIYSYKRIKLDNDIFNMFMTQVRREADMRGITIPKQSIFNRFLKRVK